MSSHKLGEYTIRRPPGIYFSQGINTYIWMWVRFPVSLKFFTLKISNKTFPLVLKTLRNEINNLLWGYNIHIDKLCDNI